MGFFKGTLIEEEELMKIIKSNFLLSGVTFSGGDPFYQIEGALKMARLVKENGYHLISYTGFLFEELVEMSKSNPSLKELLNLIDVIIDGPFIEEEKSLELRFKGSKNQRVINVKKVSKKVILFLKTIINILFNSCFIIANDIVSDFFDVIT